MSFQEIIRTLHCGGAYVVLFFLTLTILYSAYVAFSTQKNDAILRKLSLFALIFLHLQMIVGIVSYFISPMVQFNESTMKNSQLRLFAVEHPLMMLLGVICITVAHVKLKRASVVTFKIPLLYLLGAILILSRIPYDLWFSI